jgi:DNA (cytosine-5)-methyltransferase 1
MAILQGFPKTYVFAGAGISKMYRHIGDAVPPLISYQLAHLVSWILTGRKPSAKQLIMPGTHLKAKDVVRTPRSPAGAPIRRKALTRIAAKER